MPMFYFSHETENKYQKFKNQNFLQQAKKEQKTKKHKDYEDRMSEGF